MIIGSLKRYFLIFIIMLISAVLSGQQFIGVSNQNDPRYDELIEYFNEVVIGDYYIERWEQPLYIKVTGDYTEEDYSTLSNLVDSIESLGVMPGISIETDKSNCTINFDPLDELMTYYGNKYDCDYTEGDWWAIDLQSSKYGIYSGNFGIAIDSTNQEQRNYMILLSVTYAIGLQYCSDKYPDSIAYTEWTNAQSLSEMDYNLIRMLYMDSLHSGMEKDEADEILRPWVKENITIKSPYEGIVNIV